MLGLDCLPSPLYPILVGGAFCCCISLFRHRGSKKMTRHRTPETAVQMPVGISLHLQAKTIIIPHVPLVPVGQKRARSGKGFVYKDKTQKLREESLLFYLAPYRPTEPLTGPVRLWVTAWMPIPASWPQWKQTLAGDEGFYVDKTPDLDNIVKHLKDVMTQLRFWEDDRQVAELRAEKRYRQEPGWWILVGPLYRLPEKKPGLVEKIES